MAVLLILSILSRDKKTREKIVKIAVKYVKSFMDLNFTKIV